MYPEMSDNLQTVVGNWEHGSKTGIEIIRKWKTGIYTAH
jgi:hypothetical protein